MILDEVLLLFLHLNGAGVLIDKVTCNLMHMLQRCCKTVEMQGPIFCLDAASIYGHGP